MGKVQAVVRKGLSSVLVENHSAHPLLVGFYVSTERIVCPAAVLRFGGKGRVESDSIASGFGLSVCALFQKWIHAGQRK